MKLYFGNTVTTITTVMLLVLLGFMGYLIMNRTSIQYWGRRNLILLVFGLVVCCFAAARDGLDKTIQCAIDGSCAPGDFPACQFADHCWLHWRTNHHCSRHCNSYLQEGFL